EGKGINGKTPSTFDGREALQTGLQRHTNPHRARAVTPLSPAAHPLKTQKSRKLKAVNVIETTVSPKGAAEISAPWTAPAPTTEALSKRADVWPAGTKCSRNTSRDSRL